MPVRLSDRQLELVMNAAQPLPVEKRDAYLTRVAGCLAQVGYRKVRDDDPKKLYAALARAFGSVNLAVVRRTDEDPGDHCCVSP